MREHKIIIAGSRHFSDYKLLKNKCDYYLQNINPSDIEIVSGGCTGADNLGEQYAVEKGYPVCRFPADWSKGRHAGPKRNAKMARYATHLLLFWDNKSKGSWSMLQEALMQSLKIKQVKV